MNPKKSLTIIAAISVIAAVSVGLVVQQPQNLLITAPSNTITQEPNPSPPPELIELRGEKNNSFAEAIKSRDWIREPAYLPENYSLKEIRSNEEQGTGFEVLAVFGDRTMEIRDTVEENVDTGIVISYFVDGVSVDWEEHVNKMIAKKPELRNKSFVDGILIYTTESSDGINRAYYRDGVNTWVAMSSIESVDELTKILRSTISR